MLLRALCQASPAPGRSILKPYQHWPRTGQRFPGHSPAESVPLCPLRRCFSYVRPSKQFLNNIKSATNCDLRNCTSYGTDRRGHFSPLQRLRSLTSHSLVHSAGCRSQGRRRHSPGPTHGADTRTARSRGYSCSVAAWYRRDCRRRLGVGGRQRKHRCKSQGKTAQVVRPVLSGAGAAQSHTVCLGNLDRGAINWNTRWLCWCPVGKEYLSH